MGQARIFFSSLCFSFSMTEFTCTLIKLNKLQKISRSSNIKAHSLTLEWSFAKEHFRLNQTEFTTDFFWKWPIWICCYKRVDRVGEEENPTLEFVSAETEAEEARADLGTKTTRLWSAYLTVSNRETENRIGRNAGENRLETTVIGIFRPSWMPIEHEAFLKEKNKKKTHTHTQKIREWERFETEVILSLTTQNLNYKETVKEKPFYSLVMDDQ